MSLPSSVPQIQFTLAGLVIPTEADVLAGVQADMNSAFGGNLNPNLETPQGQLASSEAAIIGDKNNEIATIVNQFDPQYADGRFQDALARIYFITRKGATSTAVLATLGGIPGTIIPAGTLAQDTNGNTYASTGSAVINLASTIDVEFQNILSGPIPCPMGTLTSVYQAIPGWDTITNASAGVLGQVVESRADFEYRRKNSVALNGHGTPQSIYAEVFALPNVLDTYVLDNPSGDTVLVPPTNYPLLPHSVYVAVVGGVDADIANAIWSKKDVGCDYNGNTSVVVVDDSGYSYPQPAYTVKFERPVALPILFEVQIVNNSNVPANIVQLVQAAVLARFNGSDGTSRERIGSIVLASRYYSAILLVVPNISLVSILVGTVTPTLNQVAVGIDQEPTLDVSDITVTLI